MFDLQLKKEVTFYVHNCLWTYDDVPVTYCFLKDGSDHTVHDWFVFDEEKYEWVFNENKEGAQDTLFLMSLLKGGMDALVSHVNAVYNNYMRTRTFHPSEEGPEYFPITLKTKSQFLSDSENSWLNKEDLTGKYNYNEDEASILLKFYDEKVAEEYLRDWNFKTFERWGYPDYAKCCKDDIDLAKMVLKNEFNDGNHSIFIRFIEGKSPIFYLTATPKEHNPVIGVYVAGGDSFGNWLFTNN